MVRGEEPTEASLPREGRGPGCSGPQGKPRRAGVLLTKVVSQGLSFIHLPVNLLKCLTLRHLFSAAIMPRSCRGLPPPCWVLPASFSEQQRCTSIPPFSGSDLHGLPTLLRAGPAVCAQTLHSLGFPPASSLVPLSQVSQHTSPAPFVWLLNNTMLLSVLPHPSTSASVSLSSDLSPLSPAHTVPLPRLPFSPSLPGYLLFIQWILD